MYVLGFLFRNLDHYRSRFFLIAFASVTAGVSAFLIPVTLAYFTQQGLPKDQILTIVITIAGLYLSNLAFSWFVRNFGEALAIQFGNHLRQKYFYHIENLSVDGLTSQHSGNMLALVNRVADEMRLLVYSLFWGLLPGIATLIIFIVLTIRQSVFAGVLNVILLGIFVGVSVVLSRRMVPLSAELNLRQSKLLESYVDLMTNMGTIKRLSLKSFAEKRLKRDSNSTYEQIDLVQRFHANRWFILHLLFGAAYLGTITIIILQVAYGQASISLLILFISGYTAVRPLFEQLSEHIKSFMELHAYIGSLSKIVTLNADEPEPKSAASTWQIIRLAEIAFRYRQSDNVITIPDFSLQRGDRICITGPSGQGKSTFLSLLSGYYALDTGIRTLDGAPYGEGEAQLLSRIIAPVSQDTELFDMTLRENLSLTSRVPDKTLIEELRAIDLGAWYDSLADGLNTRLGERGVTLSSGQRQRINILRSLLLDRDIYLLDEPTSHLDAETEATVTAYLHHKLKTKTLIVVTHRPALEALCTKRVVMKNHRLTSPA